MSSPEDRPLLDPTMETARAAGASGPSATMPQWAPKLIVFTAFIAIVAFVALSMLTKLGGFIWILAISLFLSFAIEPAVNWFVNHRWTRFWATSFIMVLAMLAAIGLVFIFIPMLVNQMTMLANFVGDVVQKVNPYLDKYFGEQISVDTVRQIGPTVAGWGLNALGGVLGIVGSVVGFVGAFFAVAFFTFFAILDGPKLRRFICSFLKPEDQKTVLWTWDTALDKTGSYFYSRLLQAAIAGGTAFIVMAILRIPFALPLAVWVGLVSQFIPAIGSYIAAILPLLITLFISPTKFFILGGWFLIYQLVENYFLSPKITAKTMALHPAVALGSAFAGGALFGAIGAFVALPVAAVIQGGITTYSKRYEVMDTELTREEPAKSEENEGEGEGESKNEGRDTDKKLPCTDAGA